MANLLTNLFGRRPDAEIERYSTTDYIKWLTSNARYGLLGNSYSTYRGRPTERIENSFAGYVQGAYKSDPIVYACMTKRSSLFSEARFVWRRRGALGHEDETSGVGHTGTSNSGDVYLNEDLAVLERPWPNGTTGELLTRMIQDVDLAGNSYIVSEDGRLRRLRPDYVQIVLSGDPLVDADIDVVGYVYTAGGPDTGGQTKAYLPDEICHWSPQTDPDAQYRGMSWLTPVVREIQGDQAATAHKDAFFRNGAILGPIIKVPAGLTPQQFKEFIEADRQAHAGADNAYKTMYVGGGADVTLGSANMQQMDFKAIQGHYETRICAAAQVPAVMAGISESLGGSSLNQGNYSSAKRMFADGTLRPLWRSACAALSTILDVPADAELWYDERGISFLHEDAKDVAEITKTQILAIEAGMRAGFKPDPMVTAVNQNNLDLLIGQHTGLFSVQMQAPGAGQGGVPGQQPGADPFADDADSAEFGALRSHLYGEDPGPKDGGAIERRFNPDQPRDPGGEGGGQWIRVGAVVDAIKDLIDDEDEDAGSMPDEPDEYEDGLSQSYLDKYGGVKDHYAADSTHAIIVPNRGRMHVADDSNGRENREVLQEVTPREARTLSSDVFDVSEGGSGRVSAAGVRVDPGGGILSGDADWTGAVDVTWSGGRTSSYSYDEAFELQEGLDLLAGGSTSRSSVQRSRGYNPAPGRQVFTAEGARKYGLPIGATIPPGLRKLTPAQEDEVRAMPPEARGKYLKAREQGLTHAAARKAAGGSAPPRKAAPVKAAPAKKATPRKAVTAKVAPAGQTGLRSEGQIKTAFEMDDSKSGLSATVGRTQVNPPGEDRPGWTKFFIDITHDGESVGEAQREVSPDGKIVYHTDIVLNDDMQGRGFGSRYLDGSLDAYRRAGVERVQFLASEDVGGFAWARGGVDFANPESRSRVAARARQWGRSNDAGAALTAEIDRVASDPNATPKDFRDIGVTPGAKTWPGKGIMLGSEWDGEIDLTKPAPAKKATPRKATPKAPAKAAPGLADTLARLRQGASPGATITQALRRGDIDEATAHELEGAASDSTDRLNAAIDRIAKRHGVTVPPSLADAPDLSSMTTRQKRLRLKALGFTPEQIDELAPTAAAAKKASPPVAGPTAAGPLAVGEGAMIRELSAKNNSSVQLRKLAEGVGLQVPPTMRAKTAIQLFFAQHHAHPGLAQAVRDSATAPAPFDASSVAERINKLDPFNRKSQTDAADEIFGELTIYKPVELRKIATAVNIQLPRDRKFTPDELRRYIAERIVRDRARWSLRSETPDPDDIERRHPYPGQRWKHGWIPLVSGERLASVGEHAAQWHDDTADVNDLIGSVASGGTKAGPLAYGGSGRSDAHLADFGDGTERVVTIYETKRHADADQLASTLGRGIGVPAPRTLRVGDDGTVAELVEGPTWAEREQQILDDIRVYELEGETPGDYVPMVQGNQQKFANQPPTATAKQRQQRDLEKQRADMLASDAALRLGVLDLLAGIDERDSGTIVLTPDGIAPVQSEAGWIFADGRNQPGEVAAGMMSRANGKVPPVERRISPREIRMWSAFSTIRSWRDNPLTPADVAYLRARLDLAQPQFAKLGRQRWWKFASDRLDALASHATGTRNLFG